MPCLPRACRACGLLCARRVEGEVRESGGAPEGPREPGLLPGIPGGPILETAPGNTTLTGAQSRGARRCRSGRTVAAALGKDGRAADNNEEPHGGDAHSQSIVAR